MELYEKRIHTALDFIENNLLNDFDISEVSAVAHYSKFHFMRIFKMMTGDKLGDYIRKRRISESAIDLVESDLSILNIALKYQFESQESYTRSFKSVFDVTPGFFRKRGHKYVGFEQYKLSQEKLEAIKNFIVMEPRIETLAPRMLVGIKHRHSLQEMDSMLPIWKSFMPQRFEIDNHIDEGIYSLQVYDPGLTFETLGPNTTFDHWAAIQVESLGKYPKGMGHIEIPSGDYAVFIHKGPAHTFPKTISFIFQGWLPESEYIYDSSRPQFEIMGERYHGPSHPNSEEEVWIPIKTSKH